MTDRDKAVELLARGLFNAPATSSIYADYTNAATALLDQIAPLLTAQAVEAERAACTEELRLAVAAARAEERERAAEWLRSEARTYPVGHESKERGQSTYNWMWWCAKRLDARAAAIRKQEGV